MSGSAQGNPAVPFRLPRLYPILDVATLERYGLELRETVRALLDGGAETLQLRDKLGGPQEVLAKARAITDEVGSASCLCILNDRIDLAVLAGWSAVHLGQKDLPPEAARRVVGTARFVIGVSTHDDAQVQAAEAGTADYVAIGPVFGTTTKADAEPVVGLEGVRRARALTRKPLVAIGGITSANAAAVIEAGADSVAVIGGLFAPGASPATRVRDFLRVLR